MASCRHQAGQKKIPAAFEVKDVTVSPSGVIVAAYVRADEVKTDSF